MTRIGTVSGVAWAAALGLALTACTVSTTTVVRSAGSGTASASASGAKTSASASASPSPTGPLVTITPGSGPAGADPSPGIAVTTADGTLKTVTVTTAGDAVTGTYAAGRKSWHSTYALNVSQSYTVTATATATNGTTTKTAKFRTLTPKATFITQIFEGYQQTYGVGMPIILNFSQAITDRAAVEKSINLTTSKRVVGAWYWDGNRTLDFRPRDFWPANTTVSFTGHFNGVLAAPGLYGNHTLTQTFVIGQSVVAVASTQTHRTQIYIGGKLTYNWPISSGKPGDATPDGSYLTIEKENPVRMVGPGYSLLVPWSVRFTFSGDYYHDAYWSVGQQGFENVSHGCVNLSPADAAIYYKLAVPGDPITVTGSPRPGTWDNGWTEWFLFWNQLLQGSALHEAVVATPQGSTFVPPSALRPNTAKAPLGTAAAGNNLD
jgi:lipoprotein-anchoring transpeptidase ErfK/SrfK